MHPHRAMAIFILNKTSRLETKSQKRVESAYKIGRILEVSPQWVMCEVYPPDGKPPRPSSAQAQQEGGPRHDLDRLAIAYEYIVLVMVTLESKPRDLGFRA